MASHDAEVIEEGTARGKDGAAMTPCVECAKRGVIRAATRHVPHRGVICTNCWKGKVPPPPAPVPVSAVTNTKEAKAVPQRKQFDEARMKSDFESGLSIKQIAKRHDTTWATARARLERMGITTKRPQAERVASPSTAVVPATAARKSTVKDAPAAGDVHKMGRQVLADLRLRRAQIDTAIAAMEAIYG